MNVLKKKREKLGELLKNERERKSWSLEFIKNKLKDKMGIEISKPSLHRLEMGKTEKVNPILLKNLCKIYELDIEEIFKSLEYLDNDSIEKKNNFNDDENLISIKIFKNVKDVANYPSAGIKEKYIFSISSKEFIKNSSNLLGALIDSNREGIPNELMSTKWIVIDKGAEILNGDIGVFLHNDEYMIKKKIISTTSKIILIGSNNSAISVERKDRLKEIGKVIWLFQELKSL